MSEGAEGINKDFQLYYITNDGASHALTPGDLSTLSMEIRKPFTITMNEAGEVRFTPRRYEPLRVVSAVHEGATGGKWVMMELDKGQATLDGHWWYVVAVVIDDLLYEDAERLIAELKLVRERLEASI